MEEGKFMNTLKEDFILAKNGNEEVVPFSKDLALWSISNPGELENMIKIVIKNVCLQYI